MPAVTGAALPAQVHDCWNTIGVEGNATCRELQKFIHCRNCPVYSAAGLQLLDRPLTAEHRREWTQHFAAKKTTTTPARISVVVFRVCWEWLALPTTALQEVAERRVMHTFPHRRRSVALGLVNIRGELLICASVARLFGLEQTLPQHAGRRAFDRLLVTSWDGKRLAVPVDEVHGVHRFQHGELREPPATIARSAAAYAQGVFPWRDITVGFLNPEPLFAALNRRLA